MSLFSWLDYSESERTKVLELVSALGDRDTRDELGIGTVRDAYADILFPGTSTIQTRARYFLFVPWIYLNNERRLRAKKAEGKDDIAARLRNDEIGLINYLADSADAEGTIGIDARKTLKRLPSSIYWNGLSAWGIRMFHGSQDQYNHALHAYGPPPPLASRTSDDAAESSKHLQNWHAGLPAAPKYFPYVETSLTLSREEADYLRERIMHNCPGTFLAFLVDQGKPCHPVQFPWEHPQVGELPASILTPLRHGQKFSETIHGAALLYNYMLAQEAQNAVRIEEYEKKFYQWAEVIQSQGDVLAQWDLNDFWHIADLKNPRIPSKTKSFIDAWLALAISPNSNPATLLGSHQAQGLIRDRERFLKRGQARLFNQRALELWGGAAGTMRLDYRWSTVRTILADIQKAFAKEAAVA